MADASGPGCPAREARGGPECPAGKARRVWRRALMACVWAAALAGGAVPVQAGIVGPPAGPASHTLQWPALQALAGQRLRDPVPSRQLTPVLKKVLGARY